MQLAQFIALATLILLARQANAFNYCEKSLCPDGAQHIACNNPGTLSSRCPLNTMIVDMHFYIPLILKMHNGKRNAIAGGLLKGFKSAKRMALMQWDNELASMAELNVKQCTLNPDSCRNTQRFHYSGQNLGIMKNFNASLNDKYFIKFLIKLWWKEINSVTMDYINSYPEDYTGPTISQFMVMAAEKNSHVGCSAIRFSEDGIRFNFLLACNYATNNAYNHPTYLAGEPASACTTGRDREYKNLCSKHEFSKINEIL